ncbi:MAG: MATE family efflux transporter [Euryarchaeota archaeon]|nr:MATE family efflux transporter [Euryarchaeota archaeon]
MELDFLHGDIYSLYRKLYPAAIMSMLTATVASLADIVILSMLLGSDMISAVSVCMPIYLLLNALTLLISGGAATVYAFFIGKDDFVESNRYFSVALTVTLLIGASLTVWGILKTRSIVLFLGANQAIVGITQEYASVLMWFLIPMMIYGLLLFFVRYDGDPNRVIVATLTCAGMNIILDLLFVGPLQWGPRGAALATCLAYTSGVLVQLSHFLSQKNTLRYTLSACTLGRIWRSLKAGFPLSIAQFGMATTTAVFNIVIMSLGGEILVAVYAVVTQVSMIALAFYEGVAQAGQPILSASHGGGRLDRMREVLNLGFRYEVVVTVLCMLICLIGAPLIARAFSISEEPMLGYMLYAIRVFALAIPFTGINVLILYFFQAREELLCSTLISLLHSSVFMILGLFITVNVLGKKGIWWTWLLAEASALVISALLLKYALTRDERKENLC